MKEQEVDESRTRVFELRVEEEEKEERSGGEKWRKRQRERGPHARDKTKRKKERKEERDTIQRDKKGREVEKLIQTIMKQVTVTVNYCYLLYSEFYLCLRILFMTAHTHSDFHSILCPLIISLLLFLLATPFLFLRAKRGTD